MNLDKFNDRYGGADPGRHAIDADDVPDTFDTFDTSDAPRAAISPGPQGYVREGHDDVSIFRMALVHELRAPLQVLQGHLDALSDDADGTNGPVDTCGFGGGMAPRERLDAMRSMLGVVAGAVDDVLQLGQGDVTQLPLRETVFEVRVCLDDEVDSFAGSAHAKGLVLGCHVADDVPAMLWGDAVRLRQMLRTLLDNALKYTACGGVSVSASWAAAPGPQNPAGQGKQGATVGASAGIACRIGEDLGELTIHVSDSGPGIPVGMENAVFAAFSRVDRSIPGTGLGLWIAQQWAQRMGGALCVESSTSGARFRLSVPFAMPGALPALEATGAAVAIRSAAEGLTDMPVVRVGVRTGLRVLVVDDHVMNRAILADQLIALGCIVERAEDLTEALLQWISHDVDVVLTDVQLGGSCGLTLARTLRALAPALGRRVPVVFAVTGSVVAARTARAAGIEGVLTKPVSRKQLAQMLAVRWPCVGVDGVADTENEGDAVDATGAMAVAPGDASRRIKAKRLPLTEDPYARRMMREEMAKDIARFRRLIATRRPEDLDAAQEVLHRMRGACRMFGDPLLTARCDRLSEKLADCRIAPGDQR